MFSVDTGDSQVDSDLMRVSKELGLFNEHRRCKKGEYRVRFSGFVSGIKVSSSTIDDDDNDLCEYNCENKAHYIVSADYVKNNNSRYYCILCCENHLEKAANDCRIFAELNDLNKYQIVLERAMKWLLK